MKTFEEAIGTVLVKCAGVEPTPEEVGRVEETHARFGAIGDEIKQSEQASEAVEAMLATFGSPCQMIAEGKGLCRGCAEKLVYASFINGVIVGMEMEKS